MTNRKKSSCSVEGSNWFANLLNVTWIRPKFHDSFEDVLDTDVLEISIRSCAEPLQHVAKKGVEPVSISEYLVCIVSQLIG